MAKVLYTGISSKARKVKKLFVGIDGKARKVKKAYIGVGNKARLFFNSGVNHGLYLYECRSYILHQVNDATMANITSVQLVNPKQYTVNGQTACGSPDAMYYPNPSTRTVWAINSETGGWIRDTGISSKGHQFTSQPNSPWPRTYASHGTNLIVSEHSRTNMSNTTGAHKRYDSITGTLLSQSAGTERDVPVMGNGIPGEYVYVFGYRDDDGYDCGELARRDAVALTKIANLNLGTGWVYAWGQSFVYYDTFYYSTKESTTTKRSAATLAVVGTFNTVRNSTVTSVL